MTDLYTRIGAQDIQLRVGTKEEKQSKQHNLQAQLAKEHISNRYRLSLRVSWAKPFNWSWRPAPEKVSWCWVWCSIAHVHFKDTANVKTCWYLVGEQLNKEPALLSMFCASRFFIEQVYASILYLSMPPDFRILLRGLPVEHHSIAMDLKFTEYIVYKPQIGTSKEAANKEVHSWKIQC